LDSHNRNRSQIRAIEERAMYAIIADGGRQYRVEEGQELDLAYRDVPVGEKVSFENVLAVGGGDSVKLGSPMVKGASVTAEVMGIDNGPKINIRKLRRRKNFRKQTGHRAMYTRVKISSIAEA
jgi:large subunit ribosomal protein L21